MTQVPNPYAVPLDELEAGVHVAADDQVQEQPVDGRPDPDPRPPNPDRDWFAAGG